MFLTNFLGEVRCYMDCSFDRNRAEGTLRISQPAFVNALVDEFEVSMYSPISSYRTAELRHKEEHEPELEEPFREVLGFQCGWPI